MDSNECSKFSKTPTHTKHQLTETSFLNFKSLLHHEESPPSCIFATQEKKKKAKGTYTPCLSLRQTLSFLSVKTSRVAYCPQKIYNQAWEPRVTLKNKEMLAHVCHSGSMQRLLGEPQQLRFCSSPDHQQKCTERLWAIAHHSRQQIPHRVHRARNCSRRVWPRTVRKENTVNKPDPGQKGLEFSFSWWTHVGLSIILLTSHLIEMEWMHCPSRGGNLCLPSA